MENLGAFFSWKKDVFDMSRKVLDIITKKKNTKGFRCERFFRLFDMFSIREEENTI